MKLGPATVLLDVVQVCVPGVMEGMEPCAGTLR